MTSTATLPGAQVLAGLDAEQQRAVLAPAGPVRILAGAGTGKTRTITHRIAYQVLTGVSDPRTVLAVTHSARAAGELRDRLAALGVSGVQARTFHAAAMRQLAYFWSATGMPGTSPQLVTSVPAGRYGLLRTALAEVLEIRNADVASTDVLDVDGEVTWARARRLRPSEYAERARTAGRTRTQPVDVIAAAYEKYQDSKRHLGVLDFDDLIAGCANLLEQRPDIAEHVRAAYNSFVVDEYQDTDPAQQRLLDAWLGDRDTVTVVGDAQQAIYGFRGAEQSLIGDFTTRYPHAVDVTLVRDYRSTPQVVEAANRVLRHAPGPRVDLVGQQEPGPPPQLHRAGTETSEAAAVARRVTEHLAAGIPAAEIAVLHRFNSQAVALRAALRDAGVPVSTGDGEAFFDRPEIAAALRALAGRAQRDPDQHGPAALAEALRSTGYDKHNPPAGAGAAREKWEAQAALADLARTLPAQAQQSAQTLLTELVRRARDEHTPRVGGVITVSTIHKAKGLEWDVVLLPRLTEGSLPSAFAKTPADIDEERRLFYVAVTRARRVVEMWHAEQRGEGGGWKLEPSRFLREALPEHGQPRRSATPSGAARRRRTVSYAPGDRVTHDSFGLGRITAVDASHVTADFGTGTGIKRIRTGSSKLDKL